MYDTHRATKTATLTPIGKLVAIVAQESSQQDSVSGEAARIKTATRMAAEPGVLEKARTWGITGSVLHVGVEDLQRFRIDRFGGQVDTVVVPVQYGGEACLRLSDTASCNIHNCPTDCEVSEWSESGVCSQA